MYITYINKNQNHEGGISFVTSIPLSERGQYLERNSGQINLYIISLLLYLYYIFINTLYIYIYKLLKYCFLFYRIIYC